MFQSLTVTADVHRPSEQSVQLSPSDAVMPHGLSEAQELEYGQEHGLER